MSPAFVRERLFKPFETTKASGMGIGVYESQQYVAALGGRIEVESEEGRGTRVVVRLPSGDAAARRQSGSRLPHERCRKESLRGRHAVLPRRGPERTGGRRVAVKSSSKEAAAWRMHASRC